MRDNFRVPLAGCLNFRDLGGYACADGGTTQEDKFYRSNCLSQLTDDDIAAVESLGITGVVDLRFPEEAANAVNRMRGRNGVLYANISISTETQADPTNFPASMAQFYIDILHKSGAKVADVFRFFAAHSDMRFVFHCTAGKDRTGVIAALLLDLAGVSRGDIVTDFALTQTYMWDVFMQFKAKLEEQRGIKLESYIFEALPENMDAFLTELYKTFGGAAAYLTAQGVSKEELTIVRRQICGA